MNSVWIKNISHIHSWSKWTHECIFEFNGSFQNGSPVYKYRELTNTYSCEEWLLAKKEDGDWRMINDYGDSWPWGKKNTDRYPDVKTLDPIWISPWKDNFNEAFLKIDHLLSFINVNRENKNYISGCISEYRKEILFLLLIFRRADVNFPVEMVLTIMSFLRVCEKRF